MITAGDIRKGIIFDIDGNVFTVIDFMHVKPGKGSAFVRTKIKNVMTGQVLERTFNPSEKLNDVKIEKREMQYLYNENNLYYFMDMQTYDQIPLNYDIISEALNFIVENMTVQISFYKGEAFAVEPPLFVELEITECEPGVQGDSSKAGNKPAKLETGYSILVPLFVERGERIRVDTRTGTYMERL